MSLSNWEYNPIGFLTESDVLLLRWALGEITYDNRAANKLTAAGYAIEYGYKQYATEKARSRLEALYSLPGMRTPS